MAASSPDPSVLDRLFSVIAARKTGDPTGSYTAQLLAAGRSKIAQKVGEEAVEAIIASIEGDRAAVVAESADLLYHLMVLWADAGIDPAEVWAELARREGTSGLVEKASRTE